MSYFYGNRSPQLMASQYDYSPINSQAYPSSSGSSNQTNSYLYNTPASSTYYNRLSSQSNHSPTLSHGLLAQQQQQQQHQQAQQVQQQVQQQQAQQAQQQQQTSYPTPRTSSNYSPNFSSSSSNSYFSTSPRLRFYISKGFELEDDLEFCPEIENSANGNSSSTHKFNPYTSTSFSPQNSPISNNVPISPSTNKGLNSPKAHTPRIKKPLEIVNPLTGMRVSSPALK